MNEEYKSLLRATMQHIAEQDRDVQLLRELLERALRLVETMRPDYGKDSFERDKLLRDYSDMKAGKERSAG